MAKHALDISPFLFPDWRERLRKAVDASHMTQEEVAVAAGMKPSTLSKLLSGTNRYPRLDNFLGLLFTLELDWKYLVREAPHLDEAEIEKLPEPTRSLVRKAIRRTAAPYATVRARRPRKT